MSQRQTDRPDTCLYFSSIAAVRQCEQYMYTLGEHGQSNLVQDWTQHQPSQAMHPLPTDLEAYRIYVR